MSLPSIVSYGAAAKTSSLVWDGDLVIPDGYAIESASGEVGINGDLSISGAVSAENGLGTMKGAKTTYFNLTNFTLDAANLGTLSNGFDYGTPYAFTPTSDITLSYSDGNSSHQAFYLYSTPSRYKTLECKNNSTATYTLSSLPDVILCIRSQNGPNTVGTFTMSFSGVGYRAPLNLKF